MCEVDFSDFYKYTLDDDTSVDLCQGSTEYELSSDIEVNNKSKSDTEYESDIYITSDNGLIEEDSRSESKSDTDSSLSVSDVDLVNDDSSSASKSNTEVEGDITLYWHRKEYSKFVNSKHVSSYLQEQQYTTIVTVIDHTKDDWQQNPKITHVPIFYKHDFGRKKRTKQYCVFANKRSIACEIFSSIPYPVLNTYVHWPGILQPSPDHSSSTPYYCLHTWKLETTPHKTNGHYYNLFAVKKRYHKLYTPHSANFKFYCHPSEQKKDVKCDSSSLFHIHQKAPVYRYKYSFLATTKSDASITVINDTDNESESNCDSTDNDSEDAVVYDTQSYVRTENCCRSKKSSIFLDYTEKMH